MNSNCKLQHDLLCFPWCNCVTAGYRFWEANTSKRS